MTEHNLSDKDDAPWLDCMDGFQVTKQQPELSSQAQVQKELDQYDQNSIVPPPELVKEWQREANHNEPMFPQIATMAAQWGYQQHKNALLDAELPPSC